MQPSDISHKIWYQTWTITKKVSYEEDTNEDMVIRLKYLVKEENQKRRSMFNNKNLALDGIWLGVFKASYDCWSMNIHLHILISLVVISHKDLALKNLKWRSFWRKGID